MLNFVICDDNKAILERLSKVLESLFIKHNFDAEVSFISTDPTETLDYINNHDVNVLFLDIDLKSKISGLNIAEQVRKNNKNAYIIFTSAHLEYILVAYKYKTFDFIPKPITTERIEETVLRIIDDVTVDNKKQYIRLNSKNTIIDQDSIKFIKRDGMKLIFYADNRTYEVYSSFNRISNDLPSNFVRCHKSYIANTNKITNIDSKENLIFFGENNKAQCYIGPKYKNKLMEVFNNDGNFTNNLD